MGVMAEGGLGKVHHRVLNTQREAAGRVRNPGRAEPGKPHFVSINLGRLPGGKRLSPSRHWGLLEARLGCPLVGKRGSPGSPRASLRAPLPQSSDSHSRMGLSEPQSSEFPSVKWVLRRAGVMQLDEVLELDRKGAIIGVWGPSFPPK